MTMAPVPRPEPSGTVQWSTQRHLSGVPAQPGRGYCSRCGDATRPPCFPRYGKTLSGLDSVSPSRPNQDVSLLAMSLCLYAALCRVGLLLTTTRCLHSAPAERKGCCGHVGVSGCRSLAG